MKKHQNKNLPSLRKNTDKALRVLKKDVFYLESGYRKYDTRFTIFHLREILGDETVRIQTAAKIMELIKKTNDCLNCKKMSYEQMDKATQEIISNWNYLTLTQLAELLKNGRETKYGEIYRFDYSVLCDWIQKYLQEESGLEQKEDLRMERIRDDIQNMDDGMIKLYKKILSKPRSVKKRKASESYLNHLKKMIRYFKDEEIKKFQALHTGRDEIIEICKNELGKRKKFD